MAAITVTKVTRDGVAPATPVACSGGGDTVKNDGKTWIEVTNGSGGALVVTVDAPNPCDQGENHDTVVSVGAGATRRIGPFPGHIYTGAGGVLNVTYSGVTSLTIAAYSIG